MRCSGSPGMLLSHPNPLLLREALRVTSAKQAQFVEAAIRKSIREDATWGRCVGMAAPQIGLQRRAFIAHGIYFVNPKIVKRSSDTRQFREGCYSLGRDEWHYVRRHTWIELQWQDREMENYTGKFTGSMAQVIQHEYDHIIGITLRERSKK